MHLAPTAVNPIDQALIDQPSAYWARQRLAGGENRLYMVIDGTLYMLDPANTTDLSEVATSATGRVSTVALVILDTVDPTALTLTGRLPLPGWDVVVDGQTIYLAAGAEGLYILHLE